MITTLKDRNHLIYAYAEWNVVDKTGRSMKEGRYIYINNLWIHKAYRSGRAFQELCKRIYEHPYSQASTKVYWCIVRKDGKKTWDEDPYLEGERRITELFDKDRLMKLIEKGAYQWA